MSTTNTQYVDGFVLPLPKAKLAEYQALAEKAAAIWMEYGALDYRECVGDDMVIPDMLGFPTMTAAHEDETVVFAWITHESREKRDETNAKVLADPSPEGNVQSRKGALRLQAHGLRRLQNHRESLTPRRPKSK